jgi:7-cyano-7-deazaguanine synthase in queuosine biosynthesis
MKIDITITPPVYNAQSELILDLSASNGVRGRVKIDFSNLLQFAQIGSRTSFDFFILSSCAYGIDRLIRRRKNSVDGWSRELKVTFPVSSVSTWRSQKSHIEKLLSFLTGDYWEVDFTKSTLTLPSAQLDIFFAQNFSQVNLFSGGLDSLIGAIDFLQSNPRRKVLFVSHYDPQMHGPKGDQEALLEQLEANYSGRFANVPSTKVYLDYSNDTKETTFRSRSILFMGIALLVADAKDTNVIVPENGTVSLNYPLSSSRRSACSTRTTHPTLISAIQELWSNLGLRASISNPYEFQTKGEMVANCRDQVFLESIVTLSNSCGKRGHRAHWDNPSSTHCGVCMPCVYRRAALLSLRDRTTYGSALNSLHPFQTKKGQDTGACLEFLKRTIPTEEIKQELITNGLKDLRQIGTYASVVERTRDELKQWVRQVGNRHVKTKAGV